MSTIKKGDIPASIAFVLLVIALIGAVLGPVLMSAFHTLEQLGTAALAWASTAIDGAVTVLVALIAVGGAVAVVAVLGRTVTELSRIRIGGRLEFLRRWEHDKEPDPRPGVTR